MTKPFDGMQQPSSWLIAPRKLWAWSMAFFLASSLVMTGQTLAYLRVVGQHVTPYYILATALVDFGIFGALAPFVLWLAWRFPIERKNWGRRFFLHLLLGLTFTAVHIVVRMLLYEVRLSNIEVAEISLRGFRNLFLYNLFDNTFNTYLPILAFGHAVLHARRARERALRASRLETKLAEARLSMLKMQLQPHFLFNTLHAITALIRSNAPAAEEMLVRLSDLLRLTLDQQARQEVPLKDEADFIGQYLAIEQVRFADRLTVETQLAPETLDALVPNMILQPLVENALRHGIGRQARHGHILVAAHREGDVLCLRIQNDGPSLSPRTVKAGTGLGLANTRSRLQQLYGDQASFSLQDRSEGGADACVRIPFHTAEAGSGNESAADSIAALDKDAAQSWA
jgi:sensor histidine kinase YesM